MNPCAGATDLLVFEARPFSHLGTPPFLIIIVILYYRIYCIGKTSIWQEKYQYISVYLRDETKVTNRHTLLEKKLEYL